MEEEKYITIPQDAGPLTEINGEYYQTVIYEGQEVLMKIPTENLQVEPPAAEEQNNEENNVTYCLPNGQIVSVDSNDVSQTDVQSQSQASDSALYVNPDQIQSITPVDNAVIQSDEGENVAPELPPDDVSNTDNNMDNNYTGIKIGNRVIKISTHTSDSPGSNKRKFSEINIQGNMAQQESYVKNLDSENHEPPVKITKVDVDENKHTIAEGLKIAQSLANNKRTNLSALNMLTDKLRKLKDIDKSSKDNARNKAVLESIVGKLKQYKATIDKQDATERSARKPKIVPKPIKGAPLDEFEPPEIVCNIGFVMKSCGKTGSETASKPSPTKVEVKTETELEEFPSESLSEQSDAADNAISAEAFEVAPKTEETDTVKSLENVSAQIVAKPQSVKSSSATKPYSYTKQTVQTGSGKVTVMRTTKNDLAQLLQDLSKNQSSHKVYTVHCQSDSKAFIENIPSLFKGPNKPNVTVHVVNSNEHKKALSQHLATNKNVHHEHLTVNTGKQQEVTLSKGLSQQKKEIPQQINKRKYQQYTITNESVQQLGVPQVGATSESFQQMAAAETSQHLSIGSQEQFMYTNESLHQVAVTGEGPTNVSSESVQQQATHYEKSEQPLVIHEPELPISADSVPEQFVNLSEHQRAEYVNQQNVLDSAAAPKMSLRSLLSGTMFKSNPVYSIQSTAAGTKTNAILQKKGLPNKPSEGVLQFQIGDKTKISPELEQLLRNAQVGADYSNTSEQNQIKSEPAPTKTVSYVSPEGVQYVTGADGSVQCILPSNQGQEPSANQQVQYITPDGRVQVLDPASQREAQMQVSDPSNQQILSETGIKQEQFVTNPQSQVRYVNEHGEEIQNITSNQVRYVTEDGQEIPNPTEGANVRYVNEHGEEVKAVTTADGKIQYVTETSQEIQNISHDKQVRYVTEDGKEIQNPASQFVRYVNEKGEEVQNITGEQFQFVNEKGEVIPNPTAAGSVQYVNEKGEIFDKPGAVENVRYVNENGEVVPNPTPAENVQFVNENGEIVENPASTANIQYVNEKGEIVQEPSATKNVQYVNENGEIVENPGTTSNVQYVNEKGELIDIPAAGDSVKFPSETGEQVQKEEPPQQQDSVEVPIKQQPLTDQGLEQQDSVEVPIKQQPLTDQGLEQQDSVEVPIKQQPFTDQCLEQQDSVEVPIKQQPLTDQGNANNDQVNFITENCQERPEDQKVIKTEQDEQINNVNEKSEKIDNSLVTNQVTQDTTPTNEIQDDMPSNQEQPSIPVGNEGGAQHAEGQEAPNMGQESVNAEPSSQQDQDVKYIVTETGDVLYIVPKEVKTVTTSFQMHKYEISVNADRQFVIPVGHELQCITTDTGNVQYIVPNNEEGAETTTNNEEQAEPQTTQPVEESITPNNQSAESVQEPTQDANQQDIQFPSDTDPGVQVQYVSANGEIHYFTSTNQELVGLANQEGVTMGTQPSDVTRSQAEESRSRIGQRHVMSDNDVPDIGNCQDV